MFNSKPLIVGLVVVLSLIMASSLENVTGKEEKTEDKIDEILYMLTYEVVPRLPGAVPKTGQTQCWGMGKFTIPCEDTGQDAETQHGVAWPDPRFTDNGDWTVTDNLTLLIWAKDADLAGMLLNWDDAVDFVAGINDSAYLGFTDWRIPNVKELFSLLNMEYYGPPLARDHPFVNLHDYAGTQPYWTSTVCRNNPTHMWTIMMYYGHTMFHNRGHLAYVWPVRGGVRN